MTRLGRALALLAVLLLSSSAAYGATMGGAGGGGLPAGGSDGDCVLKDSGQAIWSECPGAGSGAPTDAKYIVQQANGTLSDEQALGALSTGCLGVTTTTGTVASRTITGTSNQISVSNGDCSGNPTLSIPSSPTLPGTTSGTFSGNLTGTVTGNASTATALAANGNNCSAGSGARGVDASGAAENCTDFMEEPAGNGIVARTSANTASNRTITGTSNEISVSNGDGVSGNPTLSLASVVDLSSKTLRLPSSTSLPGTCGVGDSYMDTNATTGQRFYLCESANTWVLQGDGGGGGSSSDGSDGAVQTADGAGGFTDSGCTAASGALVCSGGITSGTSGTGVLTLLEGTAPGAGSNSGEHNLYFDSTGSLLKSHENGGSVVTYYSTANSAPISSGVSGLGTGVATALAVNNNSAGGYSPIDGTATLTNKTLDAEGTGNVLTIPRRIWLPAAGCNNTTAGSIWDLPTSGPAVAACKTGTNTQMGVLDFADSANLSAQVTYKLPSTWTGTVDANITWLTSATSGNVVWQLATICVADAETDDPAFNTASTVTDAAKGTTLQTNDAAISTVTVTGCAAGELLHVKIQRDAGHASDNLAATARLIGVELVIREAL